MTDTSFPIRDLDRAGSSYDRTRARLTAYFDRTAAETWKRLTSDAPVSRIRETVRAGRAAMRATLLGWLPQDLRGARILDAGCGTGALAIEAAARGAEVVAIDVAAQLVGEARARAPEGLRIDWRAGDMLDPGLGAFDYAVAMDSLIHYRPVDMVGAVERLAARCRGGVLFTFAPRTPLLTAMHLSGKAFPRADRSPAIVPVGEAALRRRLARAEGLERWTAVRSLRIARGFYISQAMEVVPA